jgi:hypothetical protein
VNEFAFKVGDRVGHSEEDARLWFDENPEGLGTIVEVPPENGAHTFYTVAWDNGDPYYPHYENELVPANMG